MEDEIYQQMSLWDLIYPRKIIDKPIRLIEFFAGIGAQHKALKQLTDQVESWKICEWAYNSYCSYNAIHIKDFKDYSKGLSKEELIEKVRGTSTNYNEPLTDKQLKQKPIEWLRNAYNNIKATHNLINIMEVHGKDLEIVDTDKYEYIMTYSFPCQDLSLAGKRQGMGVSQKDGGTRSGLLWEVERILGECENKPQVLLMENVPEVIGKGNVDDFIKWTRRLEEMGYSNYFEILNAKHYGIPQNRRRCFMISLLGGYSYDFPIKIKRKYQLADLQETKVDEKYYLSEDKIKQIASWGGYENPLENAIDTARERVVSTLTTHCGKDSNGMKLIKESNLKKELCKKLIDEGIVKEGDVIRHSYSSNRLENGEKNMGRIENHDGLSPTLDTRCDCLGVVVNETIKIKNANKKGYLEANNGDGIDISSRMESHRGTVQKGCSQTLTCMGGNDVGTVENLRIRKLTPKECIRLMGFTDEDYEAMRSIGMTDSAIYHMAGDSIVVTVLISIFSQLMYEDDRHKKVVNEYIKKGIIEDK